LNEEDQETGASSNADIEDNNMEENERKKYLKWNGSTSSGELAAKESPAAKAQMEAEKAGEELEELCPRLGGLSMKSKSLDDDEDDMEVSEEVKKEETAKEGDGENSGNNNTASQQDESEHSRLKAVKSLVGDLQSLKTEWTAKTLSRQVDGL